MLKNIKIFIYLVIFLGLGTVCASAKEFSSNNVNNKEVKKAMKNHKEDEIINRDLLFGNPERISARLSPDGEYISFLAPKEGVLNVWVAPREDLAKAIMISNDTKRGIRSYSWAKNNEYILYLQDSGGDENWCIHAVNIKSLEHKTLTPETGVAAFGFSFSDKHPDEFVFFTNERKKELHDCYRKNIITGEQKMIFQNDENFSGFLVDSDFDLRIAHRYVDGGAEQEIYAFDKKDSSKRTKIKLLKAEDTAYSGPISLTQDGKFLYLGDSSGRNSAALTKMNLSDFSEEIIYYNPKADVNNIITDPKTKEVQAVSSEYMRDDWVILSDDIAKDIKYLQKLENGDMQIVSRTKDDNYWIVAFNSDVSPIKYYLYNRATAKYMFSSNSKQENLPLTKMYPVEITARDGLKMVCYLSVPRWLDNGKGGVRKPIPMVLNVHGGPQARDHWGNNSQHQLFANRGYAVLSVNYRGSTGFGKYHTNAGDGQWFMKMHDDLIDAVNWAIENKIADKDKIAIFGGSYGGYATLVGLTKTPEIFAAGVDIVGVSNLNTFWKSIPPYWKPFKAGLIKMLGIDPDLPEAAEFLAKRSPVNFANNIKKPLLIAQGANDPRVNQAESEQIVDKMKENNIPVFYILYPEEGHGFAEEDNRLSFYAQAEIFLAKFLGGRYQTEGNIYPNANFEVKAGANLGWIEKEK